MLPETLQHFPHFQCTRIAKFPTTSDSSCCTSSELLSKGQSSTSSKHPEHRIYRAPTATVLRGIFARASTRLQGLRATLSSEALSSEDSPRTSCYKQGSPGLGARIAQPDYADPATLLFRGSLHREDDDNDDKAQASPDTCPSDDDSFYEKSFETIEDYADQSEAFRDSAIFSDAEDRVVLAEGEDISDGQSRAGWVKRMVNQLQGMRVE